MSSLPKAKRGGKASGKKATEETNGQRSGPSAANSHQAPEDLDGILPHIPQRQPSHIQPEQTVPIPRLKGDTSSYPSAIDQAGDKIRIAHACDPCRSRKTKCDGERPACKHCEDNGLRCVYKGGKRDRLTRQVGTMAGRLTNLSVVLRDISLNACEEERQRLEEILAENAIFEGDDPNEIIDYKSVQESSSPNRPGLYGEQSVSARMGSTEEVDRVHEDFTQDAETQATGYHGKNSELTWMQRLKTQTEVGTPGEDERYRNIFDEQHSLSLSHLQPVSPIHATTYHCDSLPFSSDNELDLLALPPIHIGDQLLAAYLETVHPVFPIISYARINARYGSLMSRGICPDRDWLAIMNMIFAIGSKYATLINPGTDPARYDHTAYFTRAMGLTRDPDLGQYIDSILQHPTMQKIQIYGLTAMYLLSTNQVNRSWTANGVAVRHAISLGLNLRNEAPKLTEQSREKRYQIWWSLCTVERILTVMTGRSASFAEQECTVPLPLPYEDDDLFNKHPPRDINALRRFWSSDYPTNSPTPGPKSSSNTARSTEIWSGPKLGPQDENVDSPTSLALFFYQHARLGIVTSEILALLYRAPAIKLSWSQTLDNIAKLTRALYQWYVNLPKEFDFLSTIRQDQVWQRQRINLGFAYYSSLVLVNRPCLCRIDRRLPNQSEEARQFNQEYAMACVHAATNMIGLLPDEPDTSLLINMSPWWCIVHHLMQASSVLMLELSFRGEHMPSEVGVIFDAAKKITRWLKAMSRLDVAANRAWNICYNMLRQVAPKVGLNLAELTPGHEMPDLDNWDPKLTNSFTTHGSQGQGHQYPSYSAYDNINSGMERKHYDPFLPDATDPFLASSQTLDGDMGYFNYYSQP